LRELRLDSSDHRGVVTLFAVEYDTRGAALEQPPPHRRVEDPQPSIVMLALLFHGRKNIIACSTSSVTGSRIGVRFASLVSTRSHRQFPDSHPASD
jgi:hypothetical protein